MKHRKRTELSEDYGYITINGGAWETWTVGRLLDLTEELGEVRQDRL